MRRYNREKSIQTEKLIWTQKATWKELSLTWISFFNLTQFPGARFATEFTDSH